MPFNERADAQFNASQLHQSQSYRWEVKQMKMSKAVVAALAVTMTVVDVGKTRDSLQHDSHLPYTVNNAMFFHFLQLYRVSVFTAVVWKVGRTVIRLPPTSRADRLPVVNYWCIMRIMATTSLLKDVFPERSAQQKAFPFVRMGISAV